MLNWKACRPRRHLILATSSGQGAVNGGDLGVLGAEGKDGVNMAPNDETKGERSTGLFCPDECYEGEEPRVTSTMATLEPWNRNWSPDVTLDLQGALDALEWIGTLTNAAGPMKAAAKANRVSPGEDLVNNMITYLTEKAKEGRGVEIWVYVEWECCERVSCWWFSDRLAWVKKHDWHRC